jgi:DNA repair ATPase RecN
MEGRMKVEKLVIKNIGIIENETIEFNKPLNLFYGDVRQGKTTVLNAVKLCFGGGFPDDIIKHGEKKASVELYFDKGYISRKFRKDKHGVTKADKIEFINSDGVEEEKPVEAIKTFLNPFLLNQNHIIDMNEPSRQRFFVNLFGVDTEAIDRDLRQAETEASNLRVKIKAYGDISTEKIEPVDVEALQQKRKKIINLFEEEYNAAYTENEKARKINDGRLRGKEKIESLQKEIKDIEEWLEANPERKIKDVPSQPDTKTIDAEIEAAIERKFKYEQYLKNKAQASLKAEDQDALSELEEGIRDLRSNKASCLAEVNKNCTVKGLIFDEFGNFSYEDTTAGMLSTSQLMRLSSELSKLYPEGFGLELIDRGESLGKSIFEFVERAKESDSTILATIVGEKPAKVPDEIGVFVVDSGKIN